MGDVVQGVVTIAGGGVATLAGVIIGSRLAHRSQESHWYRDQKVRVYSRLLDVFAAMTTTVSRPWREGRFVQIDWTEWHRALSAVHLIATEPVASAAVRLDEIFWDLSRRMGQPPLTHQEWLERAAPLDEAHLEFVNRARAELAGSRDSLDRLSGRPSRTDPMWLARTEAQRAGGALGDVSPS